MIKKIFSFFKFSISFLIVLLVSAETILRVLGYSNNIENDIKVESPKASTSDSIFGWKLLKGEYLFKVNDTNTFTVTINEKCNRISSKNKSIVTLKPQIHVYGCSYTFGFSISDTATACYKLQNMMPSYHIVNKGVPGYGLAQMFLALKQSLIERDTPVIAIFNYASFHDMRTALNKDNSARMVMEMKSMGDEDLEKMKYPYMEIVNDSLQLKYCKFNQLSKQWFLSNYSVLVFTLNKLVFNYNDSNNKKYLHEISSKTALAIMEYCYLNNIIPIFATMTPNETDVINILNKKGYYILNYNIQIANDNDSTTLYNCGPADPWHPSGLAHTIYAKKVYKFITDTIRPKISLK